MNFFKKMLAVHEEQIKYFKWRLQSDKQLFELNLKSARIREALDLKIAKQHGIDIEE